MSKYMLSIDNGELEFKCFCEAIEGLEEEYGYEGAMWKRIIATGDMKKLCRFLNEDGIIAELEPMGIEQEEIYLLMGLNDVIGKEYYTNKEQVEKMVEEANAEYGGDFWCMTLTKSKE